MSLKKFFIFSLCCLFCSSAGFAANYGKISGKVTDALTKEALPGANVLVEGTTLGAAADVNGNFVILQVSPGVYNVRVNMIGYSAVRLENVLVQANRIAYANFELSSQVLDMKDIVVVAERPVVEKDITATTRNVTDRDIAILPTTTVNEILRTQPGVVSSGGFHLRGGRSNEVAYLIDGIPVQMTDPFSSGYATKSMEVINRNAISEMQIISGTFSAEYGNAMSGIINITTKEGGTKIRGGLDVKSSTAGMETNSRNYNRNVWRGDLSGPLVSSKSNFFISGSWDQRDNYLPWGFSKEGNVFVKITDRHLKNFKFNLAFNYSNDTHKSYSHSYKYIPDQYWYEPRSNTKFAQIGFTHTVKSNLYYNLIAYYQTYHYDSGDFDYNDLSSAYLLDANREFYTKAYVSSYEDDNEKTLGIKGDLLWQANSFNEIKAGFEVKNHSIDRFYINAPYYDDHLLDDYSKKPRDVAAFVQDKINFSSIILSAGLRFDLIDPNTSYWPSPYDAFYKRTENFVKARVRSQLSPRLGVSYPVSDKTVFHLGYGHYFQRPEYHYLYKSLTDSDYDRNIIMNLRTGNGRFGNPDLEPQKTIAYEFGISHQLLDDYLLNLSVYSKKITNLVGGRTFFPGTLSDIWETYSIHINDDFAYNNGFEIQLRKMRGRFLTGQINYTYAVAEGSSSGPLERVGIEEANRQTLKFFPLDFDMRHAINGYLAFRFSKGDGVKLAGVHLLENLQVTLLGRYGSGLAYTKGIRGTTQPYEINNARLPANWTLDLKVDRQIDLGSFRIGPYLEVYNLTNRRNVVSVDTFTGKPDFSYGRTREYAADPTNWGPPRIIYLGMQFSY